THHSERQLKNRDWPKRRIPPYGLRLANFAALLPLRRISTGVGRDRASKQQFFVPVTLRDRPVRNIQRCNLPRCLALREGYQYPTALIRPVGAKNKIK